MVSTRGSRYKFSEGERVLCYEPDPTKAKVLYDSKVLEVTEGKDKRGRRCVEYLIHFQGWNSSWDRAVSEDFVLKDTEENRQLQRDLAEQSQLQIGAYLYRRDRKKRSGGSACTTGGSSTGGSSTGAKRARHADDDADASSGASTGHHEDTETGETGDTDSSSSSQQSVVGPALVRPIAPPPMIQTNGRTAIVLPTGVRDRLTYDYHLVVKRGRLSYLPASPNVCTILESCVRDYARIGAWRTPKQAARRGRMSPVQEIRPDINDVSRRLNLMREVAEGIRVYFDFLLNRHLLYRQEIEQYHTLVGCFIEKNTAQEEELLRTMAANMAAAGEAQSPSTQESRAGEGTPIAGHRGAPQTHNTPTDSTQPSTSGTTKPTPDPRSLYRVASKQQLRSKFIRVIPVMRITRQQTDNNADTTDQTSPAVRFKVERPLDGGKPTSVRYQLRSPRRDRGHEDANIRTGPSESSIVQQMNNQVHYWANGIGEGREIVENWIERGKPETDEEETVESARGADGELENVDDEATEGSTAGDEDSIGEWVNGDDEGSQTASTETDLEDEESGSEETETETDTEERIDLAVNSVDQDEVEVVDSDEDWGAGVDIEAEEDVKPIKIEVKIEAEKIKEEVGEEKKFNVLNIKKENVKVEVIDNKESPEIKKENNDVKAEPSDTKKEIESKDGVKDILEQENEIDTKERVSSARIKIGGGKDMGKVLKDATPGTSTEGVPDSVARRLRSHKSSANSTEPCDEKPSTSTGIPGAEAPFLKESRHEQNASLASSCSSGRGGEARSPGRRCPPAPEPAVTHGGPMDPTLARGPVAKLLEKISKWELLPSAGHEHVPSKVYGAVHLSRLFVRLPDFLNAINIPEAKLKLLLSYISMFVHYLEEHKEFFGDTYYKPDAYSSRSQM